jgi:hypothetical protein
MGPIRCQMAQSHGPGTAADEVRAELSGFNNSAVLEAHAVFFLKWQGTLFYPAF